MARPLRSIGDGLVYHALNRGNNRALVFQDDEDARAFFAALGGANQRFPFRLFGYCLMADHFHLLLRPEPGVPISRILQSITVAHTWRYHQRHESSGHVWQGRFRGPVIQDDGHLLTVLRYIEANPLRAGIVSDLADHGWSSYQAHGLGQDDPLLSPVPGLDELGRTPKERQMRWRRKVAAPQPAEELKAIQQSLTGGRPFGDDLWVQETARRLGLNLVARPRGRPRKNSNPDLPR